MLRAGPDHERGRRAPAQRGAQDVRRGRGEWRSPHLPHASAGPSPRSAARPRIPVSTPARSCSTGGWTRRASTTSSSPERRASRGHPGLLPRASGRRDHLDRRAPSPRRRPKVTGSCSWWPRTATTARSRTIWLPDETLVERRRDGDGGVGRRARHRPDRLAGVRGLGHDGLGPERRPGLVHAGRCRRGRGPAGRGPPAKSRPTCSPPTTGTATTAIPTTSRCTTSATGRPSWRRRRACWKRP